MYIVLLRFSANKSQAPAHMAGHREWLQKGIADGVFLLAGSIRPGLGGAILAAGPSPEALQARIDQDPFVVHDIVKAEIIDVDPNHAAEGLALLAA
ncbi:hypothetical protein GTP81_02795 [Rugamonas sp. FT107W]|uniref:YCII-related domain-containing protein n=1 Tax=Duganella vulcania TaxID=2692166 RepID=A0A845HE57_9BURK|nr:YciI family protein [Duganella vulcania]MYM96043.1 hypothetical protein [Duganella vulcania]MYN15673.1 hypothetical protein [Duganella vulcania]